VATLNFKKIMDCCPAALVCLDSAGMVIYTNPAAARLLYPDREAALGNDFVADFCSQPPVTVGEGVREAHIQVLVDGEQRRLHCRINATFGDSCAPVGYMAAITDQTALFQVREERDRLMETATINEVLPCILHEFKNPLASIQALVELITEDCVDEDLQTQLHGILMEIRRMKLSFEGLGSSTRNLASKRNQAVDHGIREACTIFSRQLKAMGIQLETDVETLPLLPLDSGGIRGILFNLLNNAKQACRSGDSIEVHAGLTDSGRTFTFTVQDTGAGMTPEVLARCTRLFYTTKSMGSGIGLALCKTAVEKIGGRLVVVSERGCGTRISVFLPLENKKEGVLNESR